MRAETSKKNKWAQIDKIEVKQYHKYTEAVELFQAENNVRFKLHRKHKTPGLLRGHQQLGNFQSKRDGQTIQIIHCVNFTGIFFNLIFK